MKTKQTKKDREIAELRLQLWLVYGGEWRCGFGDGWVMDAAESLRDVMCIVDSIWNLSDHERGKHLLSHTYVDVWGTPSKLANAMYERGLRAIVRKGGEG